MGIFDYFKRKKQLKLERSREEKFSLLLQQTREKINQIIKNEKNYSSKEDMLDDINKVLENASYDPRSITREESFILNFNDIKEVQDAIFLKNRQEDEERLREDFTGIYSVYKMYKKIMQFIEKYYTDKNGIKVLSRKEQYETIKEIIEKNTDNSSFYYKKDILDRIFSIVFYKIITENKNPMEVLKAYNEYVHDFLKDNKNAEKEFREIIKGIMDADELGDVERNLLIRRIDFLRTVPNNSFNTMDSVPLFYDTEKEKASDRINANIARKKYKRDVTAKDLVLVRLEQSFPTNGVVEHFGEYFEPEKMLSPFEDELIKKYPDIDYNKYSILIPRFRWTTHWCINGAVGDHLNGTFSGRDYVLVEDVGQRKDDPSIAGDNVADTIIIGDIKLSNKARIIMTKEKYLELMDDPRMNNQLKNMNVVLFNGSQEECVKLLLNDMEYVWGLISSYSYCKGLTDPMSRYKFFEDLSDEEVVNLYLTKIEQSLRAGTVQGLEHCHYASEGFTVGEIDKDKTSLIKQIINIDKASKEKVEKSEKIEGNETINEKSLDKSSMLVDIHFSINSIIQYIDFLSIKFPNIDTLDELKKAAEGYWYENSNLYKDRYKKAIHDFIEVVNIEDLLAATNEYNETVREKSIEARKEKDKELLEKGLITKKEYEERQCIDVENDKKENKSH